MMNNILEISCTSDSFSTLIFKLPAEQNSSFVVQAPCNLIDTYFHGLQLLYCQNPVIITIKSLIGKLLSGEEDQYHILGFTFPLPILEKLVVNSMNEGYLWSVFQVCKCFIDNFNTYKYQNGKRIYTGIETRTDDKIELPPNSIWYVILFAEVFGIDSIVRDCALKLLKLLTNFNALSDSNEDLLPKPIKNISDSEFNTIRINLASHFLRCGPSISKNKSEQKMIFRTPIHVNSTRDQSKTSNQKRNQNCVNNALPYVDETDVSAGSNITIDTFDFDSKDYDYSNKTQSSLFFEKVQKTPNTYQTVQSPRSHPQPYSNSKTGQSRDISAYITQSNRLESSETTSSSSSGYKMSYAQPPQPAAHRHGYYKETVQNNAVEGTTNMIIHNTPPTIIRNFTTPSSNFIKSMQQRSQQKGIRQLQHTDDDMNSTMKIMDNWSVDDQNYRSNVIVTQDTYESDSSKKISNRMSYVANSPPNQSTDFNNASQDIRFSRDGDDGITPTVNRTHFDGSQSERIKKMEDTASFMSPPTPSVEPSSIHFRSKSTKIHQVHEEVEVDPIQIQNVQNREVLLNHRILEEKAKKELEKSKNLLEKSLRESRLKILELNTSHEVRKSTQNAKPLNVASSVVKPLTNHRSGIPIRSDSNARPISAPPRIRPNSFATPSPATLKATLTMEDYESQLEYSKEARSRAAQRIRMKHQQDKEKELRDELNNRRMKMKLRHEREQRIAELKERQIIDHKKSPVSPESVPSMNSQREIVDQKKKSPQIISSPNDLKKDQAKGSTNERQRLPVVDNSKPLDVKESSIVKSGTYTKASLAAVGLGLSPSRGVVDAVTMESPRHGNMAHVDFDIPFKHTANRIVNKKNTKKGKGSNVLKKVEQRGEKISREGINKRNHNNVGLENSRVPGHSGKDGLILPTLDESEEFNQYEISNHFDSSEKQDSFEEDEVNKQLNMNPSDQMISIKVIRAWNLLECLGGTNAYVVLNWGMFGKSSTHAVINELNPHFGSTLKFRSPLVSLKGSSHAWKDRDSSESEIIQFGEEMYYLDSDLDFPMQITVYNRNSSISDECLGSAEVSIIDLLCDTYQEDPCHSIITLLDVHHKLNMGYVEVSARITT